MDSLVNISKCQTKQKVNLLLSEQGLFVDVKQPSNSKILVSNAIEDQTRIENFNDNEIWTSVIKSIVPENHLRSYPESKSSLNVSSLIQIMRRHFSESESSSMLTEMSNSVQSVNESTYDFVVRLMSNQEKVMVLAITSIFVIKQAVPNKLARDPRFPHQM